MELKKLNDIVWDKNKLSPGYIREIAFNIQVIVEKIEKLLGKPFQVRLELSLPEGFKENRGESGENQGDITSSPPINEYLEAPEARDVEMAQASASDHSQEVTAIDLTRFVNAMNTNQPTDEPSAGYTGYGARFGENAQNTTKAEPAEKIEQRADGSFIAVDQTFSSHLLHNMEELIRNPHTLDIFPPRRVADVVQSLFWCGIKLQEKLQKLESRPFSYPPII